jgi:CHAT domain-containing protein/tetratricopeptide (TPR) repeat protein
MSDRSMKVAASALAIALGFSGVGAIGFSEGAIAQEQTSEINRAIREGESLFQKGNKESLISAIEKFELGLKLSQAANNKVKQSLALGWLGFIYSTLGENYKSLEYFKQALPITQALGERRDEATMLNNIGNVYSGTGENQKALLYFNQALPILRTLRYELGEAGTLHNIGTVYENLGEIQKALDYYRLALPLWHSVNDQKSEAKTLNSIASSYLILGERQKALDYYSKSLVLRRTVGDRRGEAKALNGIGLIYSELSENQKALEYYNLALPLAHTSGDVLGEVSIFNNIALLYTNVGNRKKALQYYNLALPIQHMLGDRQGEGVTLNNIGLLYFQSGSRKKALEYYNLALPIRRMVGDRAGEARTLSNIGGVYDAIDDSQKALEYYIVSLLLTRSIGDRSSESVVFNNIGYVTFSLNQPQLAIIFLKESVSLLESLRKDIRRFPRKTQEIYTSSISNTYRQLADALLSQGRIPEAQSILELLKVQESQGYGNDQEAKVIPIQFPLHPLESQALQLFEKTIASKSLTLETLKTIGQPLTQKRDRITQDMNAMPIAIGNPQAVLKANPNALLIQNLVVGDKLWVLWTNASGNTKAIVVPNVTQKELTTTVETFRKQIGSPYSNLNELKATSQKLHNWLIPPELQAELKNNPKPQLLFSLDHVTRYIPVAALYDGTQYLAQRYTLSNLITMDSDMGDRLTLQGRSPSILALGTTNAYPGFDALPNVQAELDAIVKESNDSGIFPGTVRLNAAFTADSLRGKLDAYRVLHIATHGSFNPKSITASFLLLGNGDKLPITDIASLTNLANNHLVVLSACETGLSGVSPDGSEISGISGYFLRRGAKSVMASLWAVNDASTALLMQQFYNRLSQGMTKAAAIQAVQQDFISGKLTASEAKSIARAGARPDVEGQLPPDSFSHPYFWAPFILIGNNL